MTPLLWLKLGLILLVPAILVWAFWRYSTRCRTCGWISWRDQCDDCWTADFHALLFRDVFKSRGECPTTPESER